MSTEKPYHPTLAVRHIDNWDGEGDISTTFAYKKGGKLYCHDNDSPILEYEGDEILQVWELKENESI